MTDRPLRIAVDARFLAQPLTGVQRYARELCATLDEHLAAPAARRELDVVLLAPRLDDPPPAYRHLRVRQVGRLSGHAWEQADLPRHLGGADVLFCPGNVAPLATLYGGPRGRLPVVTTVHDLAFRYVPETVSRAFRTTYEVLVPAVLRRAARVITVSEAERSRMLEHFPAAADRLVAVANGGLPRHRPIPVAGDAVPPGAPYLLYVGALNPRKNVDGVVAAARRLLAERPDLRMVFVGDAASIYQAVDLDASGEVADRIVATGKVGDAALEEFYRRASVLLFPSFHEASGLPPVEAMANGCPVVVSEIPALRERCGDAALYCDPHDVDSIVAAAARVLDDAPLAERLRADGRERAAQFTWENCLAATLDVLRTAAGRD